MTPCQSKITIHDVSFLNVFHVDSIKFPKHVLFSDDIGHRTQFSAGCLD